MKSDLNATADVRGYLRRSVGLREDRPAGDFVIVTLFGGLPPPVAVTYTATRLAGGLWAVERIGRAIDYKALTRLPPERLDYVLDQAGSDRIGALVNRPELFKEVAGAVGGCTDSPIVTIEIVSEGRRRQAVRKACPPSDLTEQLIEAVTDAASSPGN
ncbi:MAG: hypothetical protein P4L64_07875 [Caulobacteraceae bacterium]|nr:hypothetical protein [Caulobacteraceae bacterium]